MRPCLNSTIQILHMYSTFEDSSLNSSSENCRTNSAQKDKKTRQINGRVRAMSLNLHPIIQQLIVHVYTKFQSSFNTSWENWHKILI